MSNINNNNKNTPTTIRRRCARPSCRYDIVGEPVPCLKEGCNVGWCSTRCRTGDFRSHKCEKKGIDIMTHIKRKEEHRSKVNNNNNNVVQFTPGKNPETMDEKTPIIEAANMLLDSSLYCKLCHKELATITCCPYNHYCSHTCRYKDWPLHKEDCKNSNPSIDPSDQGKLKIYCRYLVSKFYSDKRIFEVFSHELEEYKERKYGPFYLCKVVQKNTSAMNLDNHDYLDISMNRFGNTQEGELFEKLKSKLGKGENSDLAMDTDTDLDLSDYLAFIFCIGTYFCHTILINTSEIFRYTGSDKVVPHSLITSFLDVESIDPCRLLDKIFTMNVLKYHNLFNIDDVTSDMGNESVKVVGVRKNEEDKDNDDDDMKE